jgi:hypothetical protein
VAKKKITGCYAYHVLTEITASHSPWVTESISNYGTQKEEVLIILQSRMKFYTITAS